MSDSSRLAALDRQVQRIEENLRNVEGTAGTTSGSAITALTGDGTAAGPGSVALTLAASGVAPGTYGDATHVAQIAVDAKGRVTSASAIAITDTGITQLTGDVTAGAGSGSQAATIASDAVTNSKLANMAQATIKGRAAGAGTGDPTDLTPAQVHAIIDAEYDAGNSGTTLTIDWANGRQQIVTLTDDVTFTLSNGINGVNYRLVLVQDGTGGWSVTWPSSVKWENDTPPTLITTASKVIFVSLVKTAIGGGGYLGFATTNPISQP